MAGAGLIGRQEPGASVFPMWFQGPKYLEQTVLLSQNMSSELEQTWSSQDLNWLPYGMRVLQADDQCATPLCCSHPQTFFYLTNFTSFRMIVFLRILSGLILD